MAHLEGLSQILINVTSSYNFRYPLALSLSLALAYDSLEEAFGVLLSFRIGRFHWWQV